MCSYMFKLVLQYDNCRSTALVLQFLLIITLLLLLLLLCKNQQKKTRTTQKVKHYHYYKNKLKQVKIKQNIHELI